MSHRGNRGQKGPYFEGWYWKHQGRDGSLALIPAIHIDRQGRRGASLQLITEAGSWWLEYPASEVHITRTPFRVELGQSSFGLQGISLRVERGGVSLMGEVRYGPPTPLRSDMMGPFRFLPMECSHGVLSMSHALEGMLTLNGRPLDFSGGIGYIETDRGRSFPRAYLWTQCLWKAGSLMLSIATIPLPAGHFTGCICAVALGGREYRLATYLGARVQRWDGSGAEVRQGAYRLVVEHLGHAGQPLRAPVRGSMDRVIRENLCTPVRYRLWRGNQLLLDRQDDQSSFEYAQGGTHEQPSD